jgi:hypothetical protein
MTPGLALWCALMIMHRSDLRWGVPGAQKEAVGVIGI